MASTDLTALQAALNALGKAIDARQGQEEELANYLNTRAAETAQGRQQREVVIEQSKDAEKAARTLVSTLKGKLDQLVQGVEEDRVKVDEPAPADEEVAALRARVKELEEAQAADDAKLNQAADSLDQDQQNMTGAQGGPPA